MDFVLRVQVNYALIDLKLFILYLLYFLKRFLNIRSYGWEDDSVNKVLAL